MELHEQTEEITFSGCVMATDWDDEDNITALEIVADDDTYCVEKNALWDELVDLCQEDLEVTGIVLEDKDGTRRIVVTDYDALTDFGFEDEESPGFEGGLDGFNYEAEEAVAFLHEHWKEAV